MRWVRFLWKCKRKINYAGWADRKHISAHVSHNKRANIKSRKVLFSITIIIMLPACILLCCSSHFFMDLKNYSFFLFFFRLFIGGNEHDDEFNMFMLTVLNRIECLSLGDIFSFWVYESFLGKIGNFRKKKNISKIFQFNFSSLIVIKLVE